MSQSPLPPASDPNAFAYVPSMPPLGPPPPKPPVWPLVIGIISTALGSLGLACDLVGLVVAMVVTPWASKLGPRPAMPQMPYGLNGPWAILSGGAQVLTATMLLVAGIVLLRRRPAARALHLSYVVLKFAVVLLSATVMIVNMQQIASMAATMPAATGPGIPPGMPASMPATMMKTSMIFGEVYGGLILMLSTAYPIFLLVWFLRRRTIDDMRAWGPRQP
jgi:hypothetical protein